MRRVKAVWGYLRPSEMTLVIAGMFVVITIATVATIYRNANSAFKPVLKYENLTPEQRRQVDSIAEEIRTGEDDPNLRFAERLREASSIGLGLSIYLLRERVSKYRVLSLADAMSEFSKSDLVPPSSRVVFLNRPTDYGLVQTARGVYYIRYSPTPLKLEVLASGYNGLADGSTFILRVPDTSAAKMEPVVNNTRVNSAGAWATVFEAPESADGQYIPPAFAPMQTFLAMNWKVKPLQQVDLPADKIRELNAFLQAQ